jgi:hypothetical protein
MAFFKEVAFRFDLDRMTWIGIRKEPGTPGAEADIWQSAEIPM